MSEALKLKWSNVQLPNGNCPYTHVTAKTPLGNFLITWKGWKKSDCPTIDETPWGEWGGVFNDVEEAKVEGEKMYFERLEKACEVLND